MIQATLPGVCIPKGIPNQVHSPYDRDLQERIGPYLVLVVRTVIGVLLGVVLSFIGIGTAWALFLFLGFKLIEVWLAFMFFGAGIGAGTAAFAAWLHLDRENNGVLALTAAVVVGAGVVGAWGGFEYGSTIEVECCAMPTKSPIYYAALGSAVLANAAGVVFAAARGFITRKSRPHSTTHCANG